MHTLCAFFVSLDQLLCKILQNQNRALIYLVFLFTKLPLVKKSLSVFALLSVLSVEMFVLISDNKIVTLDTVYTYFDVELIYFQSCLFSKISSPFSQHLYKYLFYLNGKCLNDVILRSEEHFIKFIRLFEDNLYFGTKY